MTIREFPPMRAKMIVTDVVSNGISETVNFRAVCKNDGYNAQGTDENNSYALWTPSANLSMCINNPALVGKYKPGDTFYLDFTPVGVVQGVNTTA